MPSAGALHLLDILFSCIAQCFEPTFGYKFSLLSLSIPHAMCQPPLPFRLLDIFTRIAANMAALDVTSKASAISFLQLNWKGLRKSSVS